jgi:hypothetical protein
MTSFGRRRLVALGKPPRVLCGRCSRAGLHGRVTVAEDYDRTEAAVVSSHHHAFFDVGLPLLADIYTDAMGEKVWLVSHLHCLLQATVLIFLQNKAAPICLHYFIHIVY